MAIDVDLGKYGFLTVLSTINKPRSLSELGILWFSENGRFYKPKAEKEVNLALEKGYLFVEDNRYKANCFRLAEDLFEQTHKLNGVFKSFFLHKFTQDTYYDLDVIHALCDCNPDRAVSMEFKFFMTLPLMLHSLQESNPEMFDVVVDVLGLSDYTLRLNQKIQDNMCLFDNLDDSLKWKLNLDKSIKMYKECFGNKDFASDLSGSVKKIIMKM